MTCRPASCALFQKPFSWFWGYLTNSFNFVRLQQKIDRKPHQSWVKCHFVLRELRAKRKAKNWFILVNTPNPTHGCQQQPHQPYRIFFWFFWRVLFHSATLLFPELTRARAKMIGNSSNCNNNHMAAMWATTDTQNVNYKRKRSSSTADPMPVLPFSLSPCITGNDNYRNTNVPQTATTIGMHDT